MNIDEIVNDLMISYDKVGGINHIDGTNLPSKTVIADITCDYVAAFFSWLF
jgi:hypothetical protein